MDAPDFGSAETYQYRGQVGAPVQGAVANAPTRGPGACIEAASVGGSHPPFVLAGTCDGRSARSCYGFSSVLLGYTEELIITRTILVGLAILTLSTSAALAAHRTHHHRAMNAYAAMPFGAYGYGYHRRDCVAVMPRIAVILLASESTSGREAGSFIGHFWVRRLRSSASPK
jgi:hypothetical protein